VTISISTNTGALGHFVLFQTGKIIYRTVRITVEPITTQFYCGINRSVDTIHLLSCRLCTLIETEIILVLKIISTRWPIRGMLQLSINYEPN
jgi:hypothetical protein